MNSLFANRFTPASGAADPQNITTKLQNPLKTTGDVSSNSETTAPKSAMDDDSMSSDMKAAKMGMHGKLTRSTHEWYPSKLLCKRFNVPDPYPGSRALGVPGRGRKSKAGSGGSIFERDFLSITAAGGNETDGVKDENKEDDDEEDEFSSRIRNSNKTSVGEGTLRPKKNNKMKIGPLSHLNRKMGGVDKESGGAEQVVTTTGINSSSLTVGGEANGKPSIDIFKAIFDDSDSSSSDDDSSKNDDEGVHANTKTAPDENKNDCDNQTARNDAISSDTKDSIKRTEILHGTGDDKFDDDSVRRSVNVDDGNAQRTNSQSFNNRGESNDKDVEASSIRADFKTLDAVDYDHYSNTGGASVYRPKKEGPLAFLHNKAEPSPLKPISSDKPRWERDKGSSTLDKRDSERDKHKDRYTRRRDDSDNDERSSSSRANHRKSTSSRYDKDDDGWTEKTSTVEKHSSESRHRRDDVSGRNSSGSDSEDDRSSKKSKKKKRKHNKDNKSEKKSKKSKKSKKHHKKSSKKTSRKSDNRNNSSSSDDESDLDERLGKSGSVVPSNEQLLDKLKLYKEVTGKSRPSAADFM